MSNTLTPAERSSWNDFASHLDNAGGTADTAMSHFNDFIKKNPKTTLTPNHIPIALNEISQLKSGNPIGELTPEQAKMLNLGLTNAYKNNPSNLNYPISAINGTSIEKHLPAEDPTKVRLDDTRALNLATGAKIAPGQTTGTYSVDTIKNVIKAAKHVGIDPNLALAVALQESHLGNKNPENLGNVYAGYAKAPEGLDQQAYELAAFLKEKMQEGKKLGYKDEATLIQMYNGLGKLGVQKINGKPTKTAYYGIEVTPDKPLDLKKNPLYGKTIQDLRDNVIRKNKRIQQLLSEGT